MCIYVCIEGPAELGSRSIGVLSFGVLGYIFGSGVMVSRSIGLFGCGASGYRSSGVLGSGVLGARSVCEVHSLI